MKTFQPILIQDRDAFIKAAAVLNRCSCECSFANLFVWHVVHNHRFAQVEERIIVLRWALRCLLFPMGPWFPPAELEAIRQNLSQAAGEALFWGDVPPDYVEAHKDELNQIYELSSLEGDQDYLYRTRHLASAKGRCHQNTRRLLRHFRRQEPAPRLAPMTQADAPGVLEMDTRLRQAYPTAGTDQERKVLECALEHFDALGLEGLLLFDAAGTLHGFSIWSFLKPKVVNIHFEKGLREIQGTAQKLRISVAKSLLGRAKWINLEQDVGVPGLRQSKRSYCPDHMLKRFRLKPREDNLDAENLSRLA